MCQQSVDEAIDSNGGSRRLVYRVRSSKPERTMSAKYPNTVFSSSLTPLLLALLAACGTSDNTSADVGLGSDAVDTATDDAGDTAAEPDTSADVSGPDDTTNDPRDTDAPQPDITTPDTEPEFDSGPDVPSDTAEDATTDVATDTAADAAADVSPEDFGNIATSCGSPMQDLTPVDCTVNGDTEAFCVFSNHCACSAGYECEVPYPDTDGPECSAGSVCIPAAP